MFRITLLVIQNITYLKKRIFVKLTFTLIKSFKPRTKKLLYEGRDLANKFKSEANRTMYKIKPRKFI